jgi:pilus assembly protein CpaE
MVEFALKPVGYEIEFASNGTSGLEKVYSFKPDVITTDVMMPDITGYEIVQQLRKDPNFAHLPVLVLTSQAELADKLAAFEAGADDYLSKPFQPEELVARLSVLVSRSQALKTIHIEQAKSQTLKAHVIAVHSLRGGVGCSSMAINLAVAFRELWNKPTLLVDAVLTAGQIALMLNTALRRTWADLATVDADELEFEALQSVISNHDTGLDFIAGPTTPVAAEMVTSDILQASMDILKSHYEYIVIDISHDFSESAMVMLDAADIIVSMMAPEMASIRAAAAAMNTYQKLGYNQANIKLVLNQLFPQSDLNQSRIEKTLNIPVEVSLPFTPQDFIKAINIGVPLLHLKPGGKASALLEDLAFTLSKDEHQEKPPVTPGETWQRVNKRLAHE